jgi:hypothetical protein
MPLMISAATLQATVVNILDNMLLDGVLLLAQAAG